MNENKEPFERIMLHDSGELIGAEWWHEALKTPPGSAGRRDALIALAAIGATVGLGAFVSARSHGPSQPDDWRLQSKESLELQRKYGWSLGNESDSLRFGPGEEPPAGFPPISELAAELAPRNASYRPYFSPTLFQSVNEVPTVSATSGGTPLKSAIYPIYTQSMREALARGLAFQKAVVGLGSNVAIIVDLPGPESISFAAALANQFEPVFIFDNWPHPAGVVPSHLTLAAAWHFAEHFKKAAQERSSAASPIFVLDECRLNSYQNESDRFDNRYAVQLPSADKMQSLGVRRIFYLSEGSKSDESDDLNVDFVSYRASDIEVRRIAPSDFRPKASPSDSASTGSGATAPAAPEYEYGGIEDGSSLFRSDYGGTTVQHSGYRPFISHAHLYRPMIRPTIFGGPGIRVRPPGFGTASVWESPSRGSVMRGARPSSGSWGRSSGSFGG